MKDNKGWKFPEAWLIEDDGLIVRLIRGVALILTWLIMIVVFGMPLYQLLYPIILKSYS
ncbi:hypothetical protein [Sulfuriferula nivalis]|uniref:Uncharacterized protein n=1 Tax=Sulfuriferula nivalis TaxID=2675298 RepID=A0A809RKW4_9PROT|nr:hypothetical protein [Sulfuriferula nivalis]BBO99410.1 hypothetical protein SFSGTM_01190 [Sulfuriferula nivalis]